MRASELKKFIYDNNKIEFVLNSIGCHNIKYNSFKCYYTASFPDGDNPMGVIVNNNEHLNYHSFSRQDTISSSSDIISLIQYVKGLSFKEAAKYLHSILGLKYNINPKPKQDIKKENPLSFFENIRKESLKKKIDVREIEYLNENEIDCLIPLLHISWYKEGIMPSTLNKFDLRYSYRGNRIIIPHRHWKSGRLMGFNSRTTIPNYDSLGIKKYYITPNYQKALNLYGLYENYNSIKKAGYVIVYEAEKSVLKRDSLLDSTGVALSGKILSDEQARILRSLDVSIIFAFDKDIELNEIRFACEKLWRYRSVFYVYDRANVLKEKESPADLKDNLFVQLLKNKVKYDNKEHEEYLKSLSNKR